MDDSAGRGAPLSHLVGNWGAQMKPERFGTLRDGFSLLFRRRFRFVEVLRVNQDDQASEWREKIETTPKLLAELNDKACQRGLSLFAYLAHFVSQDNEDIRRKGPRFE